MVADGRQSACRLDGQVDDPYMGTGFENAMDASTGKAGSTGTPARRYGRVITFGTFDLLHIGHVRIVQRAAALGRELYVGVSSDALNFRKKQKYPIYTEADRMEIV